jgi:hypothetical protein
VIFEFEKEIAPTLEFPLYAKPLPIPEPWLTLEPKLPALTVEFKMGITPTLEFPE